MPSPWSTPTFTEELDAVVRQECRKFWLRYGGAGYDPEELLSEAYFLAARALVTFDRTKGRVDEDGEFVDDEDTRKGKRVRHCVWMGLLDGYRARLDRLRGHRRADAPGGLAAGEGWDAWCRRLAQAMGGDAAAVIAAALHAPGEVAAALVESGWSGHRVLAAMDEVREALT